MLSRQTMPRCLGCTVLFAVAIVKYGVFHLPTIRYFSALVHISRSSAYSGTIWRAADAI